MSEERTKPDAKFDERPSVNCPRCKRIFNVPGGQGLGDVIACPFCYCRMRLREHTLLVAELVEAA